MNAVFDTNILIDALNGVTDADTEYGRYDRVLISRITWMEVLIGAPEDDAQSREFMENYFEIAALDETIAEIAVQLRRSYRLRLPDAIIWATAKANNVALVTRNTRDFKSEWDDIHVSYRL